MPPRRRAGRPRANTGADLPSDPVSVSTPASTLRSTAVASTPTPAPASTTTTPQPGRRAKRLSIRRPSISAAAKTKIEPVHEPVSTPKASKRKGKIIIRGPSKNTDTRDGANSDSGSELSNRSLSSPPPLSSLPTSLIGSRSHISSPNPASRQVSPPSSPVVVPDPILSLPERIEAMKPLPTLPWAQGSDGQRVYNFEESEDAKNQQKLSEADFQSYEESGVLFESLQRSKQKWVMDGVLERFWSASAPRRKAMAGSTDSPTTKETSALDKEKERAKKRSMMKIGPYKITVEPHIFDVTVYTVRRDPLPGEYLLTEKMPILKRQVHQATGSSAILTGGAGVSPVIANSPAHPRHSYTHSPLSGGRLGGLSAIPLGSYANSPSTPGPTRAKHPLSTVSTPISSTGLASPSGFHTLRPQPTSQTGQGSLLVTGAPVARMQIQMQVPGSTPQQTSPALRPGVQVPISSAPAVPTPGVLSRPASSSHHPQTHNPSSTGATLQAGTTPNAPSTTTNSTQASTSGGATSAPAPAAAQPPVDPVIQMLAHRASTDPELKRVMRIVASGEASPAQLDYFQRHIDELSAIVKARKEQQQQEMQRQQQARQASLPVSAAPTATATITNPTASSNSSGGSLPTPLFSATKPNTAAPITPVKSVSFQSNPITNPTTPFASSPSVSTPTTFHALSAATTSAAGSPNTSLRPLITSHQHTFHAYQPPPTNPLLKSYPAAVPSLIQSPLAPHHHRMAGSTPSLGISTSGFVPSPMTLQPAILGGNTVSSAAGPSASPLSSVIASPSSAHSRIRAPTSSAPPPVYLLLEFDLNSSDRWLLPRMTILEYDEEKHTVLASFLILRDSGGNVVKEKARIADPSALADGLVPAAVGYPYGQGTGTGRGRKKDKKLGYTGANSSNKNSGNGISNTNPTTNLSPAAIPFINSASSSANPLTAANSAHPSPLSVGVSSANSSLIAPQSGQDHRSQALSVVNQAPISGPVTATRGANSGTSDTTLQQEHILGTHTGGGAGSELGISSSVTKDASSTVSSSTPSTTPMRPRPIVSRAEGRDIGGGVNFSTGPILSSLSTSTTTTGTGTGKNETQTPLSPTSSSTNTPLIPPFSFDIPTPPLFYTPVTVCFSISPDAPPTPTTAAAAAAGIPEDDHKLLMALSRAVAPQEEVREYMRHVFRIGKAGSNQHLAYRLPREGAVEAAVADAAAAAARIARTQSGEDGDSDDDEDGESADEDEHDNRPDGSADDGRMDDAVTSNEESEGENDDLPEEAVVLVKTTKRGNAVASRRGRRR